MVAPERNEERTEEHHEDDDDSEVVSVASFTGSMVMPPTFSCCLCDGPDKRSEMIQCLTCAKMAHLMCADMENQSINDYRCKFCIRQRQELESNVTGRITEMFSEFLKGLQATSNVEQQPEGATALPPNPTKKVEPTANYTGTKPKQPKFQPEESEYRDLQTENRRSTPREPYNWTLRDTRLLSGLNGVASTRTVTDSLTQLLTRQTLQTLPEFNGDARQWPRFKAVYLQTSEAGGFSDLDNLTRLDTALKGRARATVEALLIDPSNVPDIMMQLEEIHGRPEVVINELLQDLRKLKPPREGPPQLLLPFSQKLNSLVCNIKALKKPMYLQNPMEVNQLVSKLPNALQIKWVESRLSRPGEATLAELNEWLLHQAKLVAYLPTSHQRFEQTRRPDQPRVTREQTNVHVEQSSETGEQTNVHVEQPTRAKCGSCSKFGHVTADCRQFLDLSVSKRWKKVKEKRLCLACLNDQRHSARDCPEAKVCNINGCTYRHHKLLHSDPKKNDNGNASGGNRSDRKPTSNSNKKEDNSGIDVEEVSVHTDTVANEKKLLKIIPVTIYGPNSKIMTHALLDDGSTGSLIEKDLAEKLNLIGRVAPLCMRMTGGRHQVERESMRSTLKIAGSNGQMYKLDNVRTGFLNLQAQTQSAEKLKSKFKHLSDLPIASLKNARPEILIGVEHTHLLTPLEVRFGRQSEPIGIRTLLGWTVAGKVNKEYTLTESVMTTCECESNDASTNSLLKSFFSLESLGTRVQPDDPDSIENNRAREIIKNTMQKISNNQYEIGLFWRKDDVKLCNSYSMALRRLEGVEHKMKKDPDLTKWYREKFQEYLEKQYMRKATEADLTSTSTKIWYLPHFCVTNHNKDPPKRRLVFDAAAKVGQMSLNSTLIKGPDQNASLLTVLYQFRQYRIGVVADVKEMFSQIRIKPEDQQSQRILWRDGDDKRKPEIFIMQAMTFGSTCSPASAQAIKNHNANLFRDEFPEAAAAIVNNMYVDDYLNSYKSVNEAVSVAKQIIDINKNAGFLLRNFSSNSLEVLKQLDPECINDKSVCMNLEDENNDEKVLGLWWCTKSDTFNFRVDKNLIASKTEIPTKRQVLRAIMRIFDPLGFISHVIIRAKVIMQDTWKDGLGWDERLNDQLFKKWRNWLDDLEQIKQVKVPRCYYVNFTAETRVEIHTFVDASLSSYAAVCYFRFERSGGVHVALASSKARVAPTKCVSVPRLELLAALLGTRMANHLKTGHTYQISQEYFWSDSSVVLSWIRSTTKKYKQFVGFRKSEINDTTAIRDWHHVPTKLNVADMATKWSDKQELNDATWFGGPAFLKLEKSHWPSEKQNEIDEDDIVEVNYHIDSDNPHEISFSAIDETKYSDWRRLVRVTAYVQRFMLEIRYQDHEFLPYLSVECLVGAQNVWIKKAQYDAFPDEVEILRNQGQIESRSAIFTLSPIMFDDGTIRIRSRHQNATAMSMNAKNPIILPNKHHITRLIVKHYHEKYLHLGQETVLAAIRQRFWIINARTALNSVKKNCQYCKNKSAMPIPPQMGNLPSCRNSPSFKPFTHTGVDIFGPLLVTVNKSHQKRYGVIFVCMSTRAIHIELATDLSSDAFMVCLRNFIFRRGPCTDMYSDNGTNLIGASRLIAERAAELEMKWHFIPPSAPHFGGAWERLIQSVKKCIAVILQSTFPKEDVLRSVLIEAEFIVNSRPLTHIPLDADDSEVLTPNHFLFGCAGNAPQALQSAQTFQCERRHWKLASNLSHNFWCKWLKEYLPEICRRTKWHHNVEPIRVGDIGLIADENSPRKSWRKAEVIATHPGSDGIVRTITLRTTSGEMKRPVTKFAKLDTN